MSLETLSTRINYRGGRAQEDRMIRDKEKSLKKTLLYSYQADTAILADGREFRCLINKDKENGNEDNDVISILYKDICLNKERVGKTSQGEEEVGLKCGDVFVWKETNTHWLVFLQYLKEKAYFRSQIRRCDQVAYIDGKEYWTYIRGPVETDIVWRQKNGLAFNDMNYSLVMFITKDEHTLQFLHRFSKIKVGETDGSPIAKTWEVEVVNPYFGDNIIQVFLKEYFENTVEEEGKKEWDDKHPQPEPPAPEEIYIDGPLDVRAYDTVQYTIKNLEGGSWYVIEKGTTYDMGTDNSLRLDINRTKGTFVVGYKTEDSDINITVTIRSI